MVGSQKNSVYLPRIIFQNQLLEWRWLPKVEDSSQRAIFLYYVLCDRIGRQMYSIYSYSERPEMRQTVSSRSHSQCCTRSDTQKAAEAFVQRIIKESLRKEFKKVEDSGFLKLLYRLTAPWFKFTHRCSQNHSDLLPTTYMYYNFLFLLTFL